jgi:hypothetical protein
MSRFRFETVAFHPDSSGWRVAVEWIYTTPQEERDLVVYPIVGWVVQEQRDFMPDDPDEYAFTATGETQVLPAIFDPEGVLDVVSVHRISQLARETSNLLRADYRVLSPSEPDPEGYVQYRPASL